MCSGMRTRPGLADYLSHHYCPEDGTDQVSGPTATTLEYAIADAAIGRFAAMQGDQARAAEFAARGQYWHNVFDPAATSGAFAGYMQPRLAMDVNGAPAFRATDVGSGHSVIEGSLAQYTFLVPQDVPGLVTALGGDAQFIARLDDHLMQVNAGTHGPYFYIGNEPGFATPWEYPFAGAPWKTQEAVTRIARTAFSVAPSGLPGNEDLGAMSSWLVWAMLGIYPEVPGVPGLVIGSPAFPAVDLQVAGRQHFRITARDVSPAAIYIQDATLNGSALPGPWLPLLQMRDGGELALTMGAGANMMWGAAAASRPQALMQ
jgi:predicted alpha-1,2-mannosidase